MFGNFRFDVPWRFLKLYIRGKRYYSMLRDFRICEILCIVNAQWHEIKVKKIIAMLRISFVPHVRYSHKAFMVNFF